MDKNKQGQGQTQEPGQDSGMQDSELGGYQEGQASDVSGNQASKGEKGGSTEQQQQSEDSDEQSESEDPGALLGEE